MTQTLRNVWRNLWTAIEGLSCLLPFASRVSLAALVTLVLKAKLVHL